MESVRRQRRAVGSQLQSAVFYPLNVLYLILPVEQAMGYTAVLHAMLAGLAMYAWGRAFGLRPLSALVGALAFQLSQFFIARFGFLSITATFPWLAIWLWRAEILTQRRRLSDALWLALAIGLGLLAGHAQTAGAGLIVVVCYAAVRSIPNTQSPVPNPNLGYPVLEVGYWVLGIGYSRWRWERRWHRCNCCRRRNWQRSRSAPADWTMNLP